MEDNARTWENVSQILTRPEYCDESKDGFNEPNMVSGAQKATCGYSSMVPLDGETALIAYSEFDYPEGRKAGNVIKRIIVRQIRIKEY